MQPRSRSRYSRHRLLRVVPHPHPQEPCHLLRSKKADDIRQRPAYLEMDFPFHRSSCTWQRLTVSRELKTPLHNLRRLPGRNPTPFTLIRLTMCMRAIQSTRLFPYLPILFAKIPHCHRSSLVSHASTLKAEIPGAGQHLTFILF